MSNPTTREKLETGFNEKFGFGIWDSRAADGHRSEGIASTEVLNWWLDKLESELTLREKEVKKGIYARLEDMTFADAFVGFSEEEWKGAKKLIYIIRPFFMAVSSSPVPLTSEDNLNK